MREYIWETAEELDIKIAKRLREIRRRKRISQESLSRICGVSLGSVKRFEGTGLISFLSLTRIAMALGCAGELRELFSEVPYENIQEVIRDRRNAGQRES